MKRLEIFKPGKHTASNGKVYEFTEQQLRAAVAAYDPTIHEAPLVVGHPKTDAPAYGWVKSLAFNDVGGIVLAEPGQVEPQFSELVSAGRFKKRSASWYLPDAPSNPKPGVLYLKHVGFLGAVPPSIKGLKDVAFADGDELVVEFGDYADSVAARLFRRIRDWMIADRGLDAADKIIPEWDINSLEDAARSPAVASPSYTEPETHDVKTQAEIDAEAARLKTQADAQAAKDAEFAERERKLQAQEETQRQAAAAQRRTAIAADIDALVAAGKVLPKDKAGLCAFVEAISADASIEFGEGDSKAKLAATDWLKQFLAGLPKAVDFSERGKGENVDVNADDAAALAKAAVEFQESEREAGREISVTSAVMHVRSQNK